VASAFSLFGNYLVGVSIVAAGASSVSRSQTTFRWSSMSWSRPPDQFWIRKQRMCFLWSQTYSKAYEDTETWVQCIGKAGSLAACIAALRYHGPAKEASVRGTFMHAYH